MTGPAPDGPASGASGEDATARTPGADAVPDRAPSGALRLDAATTAEWRGEGMRFVVESGDAPAFVLDGNGRVGPSPMQLLLHSLAGCTSSDIVDILAKMRVAYDGLHLAVTASRAETPPRRYTAIHLHYRVGGVDPAHEAKVRRAVDLSLETYCSVVHSLREDIPLTVSVELT